MTKLKIQLLLPVLVLLAACAESPSIPKLVPIEEFDNEEVVQDLSGAELSYPSVDILVVMDGSGSMGSHQQNVEDNIDVFVERLAQAKLDYHIAVTVAGYKRDALFKNIYPNLNDPANSGLFHTNNELDQSPYFVTNSTPQGVEILKKRLRVSVAHDSMETFFAPVLDAIAHSFTSPQNVGFFRPDAYFAPIFITDTEDQSSAPFTETPLAFWRKLIEFKGSAELIAPYSVHIPLTYGSNPPCRRDPVVRSSGPARIEEFLALAGGTYYDICASDFGVQLSRLGDDLVKRISSVFELDAIPDPSTIRVRFGDIEIPNDPRTGWTYLPDTNRIQLGPDVNIPHQAGVKVKVEFQKANRFHQ